MTGRRGYQQGDVILEVVDRVPRDAFELPPGPRGHVLAEGESTGHAHVLEATPHVKLYERDGVLYLDIDPEGGPARLRHEEHHTQLLQPGAYRVGLVQTVDPFTRVRRAVMD
jgi:hypothetical protein